LPLARRLKSGSRSDAIDLCMGDLLLLKGQRTAPIIELTVEAQ
jgi:hypothetical protein